MPKMVRDGRLGAMDVSMKARRWMLSQSDLDDPGWIAMIQENTVFGHLTHEKRLNFQDSSKMVASLELARWPCWLVMIFFWRMFLPTQSNLSWAVFPGVAHSKGYAGVRGPVQGCCAGQKLQMAQMSQNTWCRLYKCPSGHFLPMSCAYVTSGRTIWSMGMASLCGLMAIPLVWLGILLFCWSGTALWRVSKWDKSARPDLWRWVEPRQTSWLGAPDVSSIYTVLARSPSDFSSKCSINIYTILQYATLYCTISYTLHRTIMCILYYIIDITFKNHVYTVILYFIRYSYSTYHNHVSR